MPTQVSFSLYDHRHADTFVVYLLDNEFDSALRYVAGIGRNPISYAHLADVPEPYRSQIAQEIAKRSQV